MGSLTPKKSDPVIYTVITALMTGLVLAVTFIVSVPISAVGQVFDGGDIMIFVAAWTFGPFIGGFAGGVGSALSDVLMPSTAGYAPFTLVIKGLEGFAAGYLSSKFSSRRVISWTVASAIMVGGYFVTNMFLVAALYGVNSPLNPGVFLSLWELPFDLAQVVAGGIVGAPVSRYLKNSLPSLLSRIGTMPSPPKNGG
jgi:uncharacterized membrane protein